MDAGPRCLHCLSSRTGDLVSFVRFGSEPPDSLPRCRAASGRPGAPGHHRMTRLISGLRHCSGCSVGLLHLFFQFCQEKHSVLYGNKNEGVRIHSCWFKSRGCSSYQLSFPNFSQDQILNPCVFYCFSFLQLDGLFLFSCD